MAARLSNKLCREVAETVRMYHVPVFYEASDAVYMDWKMPEAAKWEQTARDTFHVESGDIEDVLGSETKVYDKLLLFLKKERKRKRC